MGATDTKLSMSTLLSTAFYECTYCALLSAMAKKSTKIAVEITGDAAGKKSVFPV